MRLTTRDLGVIVGLVISVCSSYSRSLTIEIKSDKERNKKRNLQKYHASGKKKSKSSLFTETIFGNFTTQNYFYVNVFVGNPPVKQSLILDTGTIKTGLACIDKCEKCGDNFHLNSPYKLQDSNESSILTCENENKVMNCNTYPYAVCNKTSNVCEYKWYFEENSSYEGIIVGDVFSFSSEQKDSIYFSFGCNTYESDIFYEQKANGVLGLAKYPSKYQVVNKLYESKVIKHNVFTLCFAQNGGYFTLGGVNTTFHSPRDSIAYVKQNPYETYYKLNITGLSIGSKEMILGDKLKAIIDSSNTLTMFPKSFFSSLQTMIGNQCSETKLCNKENIIVNRDNVLCYKNDNKTDSFSDVFLSLTSSLTLTFEENVIISNPIKDFSYLDDSGNICIGIAGYDEKNEIILGATFMYNKDIIFDNEKERIGIISANCDMTMYPIDYYSYYSGYFLTFFYILFFAIIAGALGYFLYKKLYQNRKVDARTLHQETDRESELT